MTMQPTASKHVVRLFLILMERLFIHVEEGMMEAKFEQAWVNYKTTVRRWISLGRFE